MKSFLLVCPFVMASAFPAFAQGPCNAHPLRPDGRNTCLERPRLTF